MLVCSQFSHICLAVYTLESLNSKSMTVCSSHSYPYDFGFGQHCRERPVGLLMICKAYHDFIPFIYAPSHPHTLTPSYPIPHLPFPIFPHPITNPSQTQHTHSRKFIHLLINTLINRPIRHPGHAFLAETFIDDCIARNHQVLFHILQSFHRVKGAE